MFGKQVTIPRPAFVIRKSPERPVSILTKGVGRGQWPLTFKGSGVFQKGLWPLSTSSQACRWTAAVGLALSHLVRPSEWSWSAASATRAGHVPLSPQARAATGGHAAEPPGRAQRRSRRSAVSVPGTVPGFCQRGGDSVSATGHPWQTLPVVCQPRPGTG